MQRLCRIFRNNGVFAWRTWKQNKYGSELLSTAVCARKVQNGSSSILHRQSCVWRSLATLKHSSQPNIAYVSTSSPALPISISNFRDFMSTFRRSVDLKDEVSLTTKESLAISKIKELFNFLELCAQHKGNANIDKSIDINNQIFKSEAGSLKLNYDDVMSVLTTLHYLGVDWRDIKELDRGRITTICKSYLDSCDPSTTASTEIIGLLRALGDLRFTLPCDFPSLPLLTHQNLKTFSSILTNNDNIEMDNNFCQLLMCLQIPFNSLPSNYQRRVKNLISTIQTTDNNKSQKTNADGGSNGNTNNDINSNKNSNSNSNSNSSTLAISSSYPSSMLSEFQNNFKAFSRCTTSSYSNAIRKESLEKWKTLWAKTSPSQHPNADTNVKKNQASNTTTTGMEGKEVPHPVVTSAKDGGKSNNNNKAMTQRKNKERIINGMDQLLDNMNNVTEVIVSLRRMKSVGLTLDELVEHLTRKRPLRKGTILNKFAVALTASHKQPLSVSSHPIIAPVMTKDTANAPTTATRSKDTVPQSLSSSSSSSSSSPKNDTGKLNKSTNAPFFSLQDKSDLLLSMAMCDVKLDLLSPDTKRNVLETISHMIEGSEDSVAWRVDEILWLLRLLRVEWSELNAATRCAILIRIPPLNDIVDSVFQRGRLLSTSLKLLSDLGASWDKMGEDGFENFGAQVFKTLAPDAKEGIIDQLASSKLIFSLGHLGVTWSNLSTQEQETLKHIFKCALLGGYHLRCHSETFAGAACIGIPLDEEQRKEAQDAFADAITATIVLDQAKIDALKGRSSHTPKTKGMQVLKAAAASGEASTKATTTTPGNGATADKLISMAKKLAFEKDDLVNKNLSALHVSAVIVNELQLSRKELLWIFSNHDFLPIDVSIGLWALARLSFPKDRDTKIPMSEKLQTQLQTSLPQILRDIDAEWLSTLLYSFANYSFPLVSSKKLIIPSTSTPEPQYYMEAALLQLIPSMTTKHLIRSLNALSRAGYAFEDLSPALKESLESAILTQESSGNMSYSEARAIVKGLMKLKVSSEFASDRLKGAVKRMCERDRPSI